MAPPPGEAGNSADEGAGTGTGTGAGTGDNSISAGLVAAVVILAVCFLAVLSAGVVFVCLRSRAPQHLTFNNPDASSTYDNSSAAATTVVNSE